MKRPGDAVEHFQKVVDLDPGYAFAWDYLALNLERLGKSIAPTQHTGAVSSES